MRRHGCVRRIAQLMFIFAGRLIVDPAAPYCDVDAASISSRFATAGSGDVDRRRRYRQEFNKISWTPL